MMSMACGLATTGKVPYASTFAIFATGRAYDQVRRRHRPQRAAGAGVRLARRPVAGRGRRHAPDDRGHRPDARDAEDAGVVPADYNQAYRAVLDSYDREGPMYMRFGRPATPFIYDEVPESLGGGVDVLREGSDISIFACGHMVWRALEAAEQPAPRGGHRRRGAERRDHQAAGLRGRAVVAGAYRARRDGRGAPHRRRARRRGPRGGRRAVPGADPRRRGGRHLRHVRHGRSRDGALRPDRRRASPTRCGRRWC